MNSNADSSKDIRMMRDLLVVGVLTSSHAQFGESWREEGLACSAQSQDVNPCDLVGYEVKRAAIEQCAIIQVGVTLYASSLSNNRFNGTCVYITLIRLCIRPIGGT